MKRASQKQAGRAFRKGTFWYIRYREPGGPRLSVITTCGSANVTTTINICVKMVSQDAEEQ